MSMAVSYYRPEVGKLRSGGRTGPDEQFTRAGSAFTITSPKAKLRSSSAPLVRKTFYPPHSPSMLTCPLKKMEPDIRSFASAGPCTIATITFTLQVSQEQVLFNGLGMKDVGGIYSECMISDYGRRGRRFEAEDN